MRRNSGCHRFRAWPPSSSHDLPQLARGFLHRARRPQDLSTAMTLSCATKGATAVAGHCCFLKRRLRRPANNAPSDFDRRLACVRFVSGFLRPQAPPLSPARHWAARHARLRQSPSGRDATPDGDCVVALGDPHMTVPPIPPLSALPPAPCAPARRPPPPAGTSAAWRGRNPRSPAPFRRRRRRRPRHWRRTTGRGRARRA